MSASSRCKSGSSRICGSGQTEFLESGAFSYQHLWPFQKSSAKRQRVVWQQAWNSWWKSNQIDRFGQGPIRGVFALDLARCQESGWSGQRPWAVSIWIVFGCSTLSNSSLTILDPWGSKAQANFESTCHPSDPGVSALHSVSVCFCFGFWLFWMFKWGPLC